MKLEWWRPTCALYVAYSYGTAEFSFTVGQKGQRSYLQRKQTNIEKKINALSGEKTQRPKIWDC